MRVSRAQIQSIVLELDTDKYGTDIAEVAVRQASNGDAEYLTDYLSKTYRKLDAQGDVVVQTEYNWKRYERKMASRLLVDCNIEDEAGKRFFPSDGKKLKMTSDEFDAAWDDLPTDIADAITKAIYEVNPTLAPI